MFRHRVRPPTPPLDEATAERLLGGAPLDDLPDAFRPLGQLLAAASGPPTDDELAGSAAAAAAFVAAHDAARPRRRRMSLAASAFTALALVASTGTAFAASQGALPEPMQQVAHETLQVVGISVPDINDHDTGDTRNEPAVATVGATNDSTTRSPVTTPPHGTAGVNSTLPAAPDVTTEPASGNNSSGKASTGAGNTDQGDPQSGGNNGGNGDGNGDDGTADEPASNLPSQSHGNGNGGPHVPPGQAKKTP